MRQLTLLIALALLARELPCAHATTFNYTGNVVGMFGANFNNAANWSPAGGPPAAGDTATIEKNHIILLTASTAALQTLNIRAGATLFTADKGLNVTGGGNGFTEVVDNSALVIQPGAFFTYATDTLSLRLGGELHMAGGAAAATFVLRSSVTGLISGHGSIALTATQGIGLDSAGIIHPNGGDLNIGTSGSALDLDGNSAGNDLGGTLDVIYDGSLTLNGPLADPFSGRMDIGNNNRVQFNSALPFDGQLNVTSGTTNRLIAPFIAFQDGADITVQAADVKFEGETSFNTGSTVFLLNAADDLRLGGNSSIQSGVPFTGAGTVQMTDGSKLTLLEGANVGVRLFNTGAGELRIGSSTGIATVGGYQQSASSDLRIELGGLAPAQFDRLAITGDAALGGVLAVSLLPGFTLTKGNSFEILDIGGARTGTFANLAEGAKVATLGKDLFITYAGGDGNDVVLFTKGLSADFDNDNDVDGADFRIWQRHLGLASGALSTDGDADGDGAVDKDDLVLWKAQFGSIATAADATQTVPEPATIWPTLAALTLVLRRRILSAPGSSRR